MDKAPPSQGGDCGFESCLEYEIEKNMFVSVGGNGHAAKSSDHIGFISAKYITTGQWDKNLNRKKFTLKENI